MPIDSAVLINDQLGEDMIHALPIRRKRADTKLTVENFAQLLDEAFDHPNEESDSSDESAEGPIRKSLRAKTKRAPRKLVRYGTVEVKDIGVQVSGLSLGTSADEEPTHT